MEGSSPSLEETLAGDATLDGSSAPQPARPSAPQRGASIGRYVILERIGRGGMGVVYAAYDPELDRKIALKVLVPRHRQDAEDAARQRLVREAQAMARVSHPHVVAVHDVGLHEGRVFVAMEFVDGPTLGRWLEAEPRTPRQILEIFAQAGRGLAAAHAKGLIHRDFKPDNVMVGHDDSEASARAQVLDFGLVRASSGDEPLDTSAEDLELDPPSLGPNDQALTRMGQLMGTPAFMAPEQFCAGPVDARTDQFAFCVALWSALYGQDPFGAGGLAQRASRVLAGERDDPPSVAGVSPRLRRVLERGLSVDRADRWPTMDSLLAELLHDRSRLRRRVMIPIALLVGLGLPLGIQQIAHARAVRACQRTGDAIDEVWTGEMREEVRAGFLATGIERAAADFERLEPWIEREVELWREARVEACMADEIEERWDAERSAIAFDCLQDQERTFRVFLRSLFAADQYVLDTALSTLANRRSPEHCVDDRFLSHEPAPLLDPQLRAEYEDLAIQLPVVSRKVQTSQIDEAAELIDELRPRVEALGHGATRLRLMHMEAKLHDRAQQRDESMRIYRAAFSLALEQGAISQAGDIALDLTAAHLHRKELGDALWMTKVAESLYRRTGETDDGLRMFSVRRIQGWVHHHSGQFDQALETVERALAIGEAYLGAEHPQLSKELCLIAMIQSARNERDDAERFARRCIALREQTQGPEHPQVALALQVLGDLLVNAGRRDEAIEAFERALAITRESYPADHPELATTMGNLGMALNPVGRHAEAKELTEKSIAILEATGDPLDYSLGLMLINLGNAQQGLSEHEAACESYLRALKIIDANPEAGRVARGPVLGNVANSEHMLGRFEDALAHQQEALELLESLYGPEHPQIVHVLGNLAATHAAMAKWESSLTISRRALDIGERVLGPEHLDLSYSLAGMAKALLSLDRAAEALEPAERALSLRRTANAPASEMAEIQWIVAQVLRANGREPERALALAREARVEFESSDTEQLPDVREFLTEP